MSKQDRQGVRSPAELERKYSFGQVFSNQDETNARQSKEIEQMAKAMSGNTSSTNFAITQINARLSAVEQAIAELPESPANIATLETTVAALETRLAAVETTLLSLESRVAALEGVS